jgi:hypothetical protein
MLYIYMVSVSVPTCGKWERKFTQKLTLRGKITKFNEKKLLRNNYYTLIILNHSVYPIKS